MQFLRKWRDFFGGWRLGGCGAMQGAAAVGRAAPAVCSAAPGMLPPAGAGERLVFRLCVRLFHVAGRARPRRSFRHSDVAGSKNRPAAWRLVGLGLQRVCFGRADGGLCRRARLIPARPPGLRWTQPDPSGAVCWWSALVFPQCTSLGHPILPRQIGRAHV